MGVRINWNAEPLYKELDKELQANAWKAANIMAAEMRQTAPVYSGPPRSSGRAPGTMRDGIIAKKLRKWSRVYIPHPGSFVEFGVNEDHRAPVPFIKMAMDASFKAYVESFRNII